MSNDSDKILILCDRCRREFEGEHWMMTAKKEILCPTCYRDKQENGE